MIEFRLGLEDLAGIRFAYSPLQEAVFSMRARSGGARLYPEQQGWFASWQAEWSGLDRELLEALVTPGRWVPDFLTPRPQLTRPDIAAELRLLRATPAQQVRAEFEAAYHHDGNPLPPWLTRALDRSPDALLARVCEALAQYWERCLLPAWWPRARSVLEADVAHRGRMLSERGAAGLFADLDGRVQWKDGTLRVVDRNPAVVAIGAVVPVDGRGLLLIPTMFALGALTQIDPANPPLICYPARGKAALGQPPAPGRAGSTAGAPAASLVELLGAPRARLLALLEQPATTTELAHLLQVTPGAVSRHLTALTAAGLLERTRLGRCVVYRRSALGDTLGRH
jgi:hypothetical protein